VSELIVKSVMPELRSMAVTLHSQAAYVALILRLRASSPLLEDLEIITTFGLRAFEVGKSKKNVPKMSRLRRLILNNTLPAKAKHLGRIGEWIPELRELTIYTPGPSRGGTHECGHEEGVTERGLALLSASAPRLEYLLISADVKNPDVIANITIPADPFPSLETLVFSHLGVEGPEFRPVAKWLAELCPNVEEMEVDCLCIGVKVIPEPEEFIEAFAGYRKECRDGFATQMHRS